MIISSLLVILTSIFIINMALYSIRPPKVEVHLSMNSPSPINFTTIRALWDCFDRFERIFEC